MEISIMEISKTYNVQFFFTEDVHTTVTANAGVVEDWIAGIQSQNRQRPMIVGLDVEWRPSFTSQRNPVATLQLCVGERCLIYQIFHSYRFSAPLASFLSNSGEFGGITFVGVGIKADLEKLQIDYGIGGAAYYVDLRGKAAEAYCMEELKGASLKKLASVVLRKEVEKPKEVTMSRWDDWWLTAEQVKYACVDAYLSFQIGMALGLDTANIAYVGTIFTV